MLQLGNRASLNGIKPADAGLLETILIQRFSHGAAGDVLSQCFEEWSHSGTFINDVIKRIIFNSLFTRPLEGFIKQHMDSTIAEGDLMQIYAKVGSLDKTCVTLPPIRFSSEAPEKSRNTLKRYDFKHRRSKQERSSSRRSESPKKRSRVGSQQLKNNIA